jgi:hypothetical protein
MSYLLLLPIMLTLNTSATTVRGQYVEARTCDVFTGACFANADTGLIGKHAVLAWKVETGCFAGTRLDGLGVVAVVAARDTLGLKQTAAGKAIVIVDAKATSAQREALVKFARAQAGDLARNVVAVRTASVDLTICPCDNDGCATLRAGDVRVSTRCINLAHDKACGNEDTQYPPLARGVSARAAMAVEHCFSGKGFDETWSDANRRGAFVGTFTCR